MFLGYHDVCLADGFQIRSKIRSALLFFELAAKKRASLNAEKVQSKCGNHSVQQIPKTQNATLNSTDCGVRARGPISQPVTAMLLLELSLSSTVNADVIHSTLSYAVSLYREMEGRGFEPISTSKEA